MSACSATIGPPPGDMSELMCAAAAAAAAGGGGVASEYPLSNLYHNLQMLHLHQNQMVSGYSGGGVMSPGARMQLGFGQVSPASYVDETMQSVNCTDTGVLPYAGTDVTSPEPMVVPFGMDGLIHRNSFVGGTEPLTGGVASVVGMDSIVCSSPPLGGGHPNLQAISEDAAMAVGDSSSAVMQDVQQRLMLRPNISPPNPVINVTDAHGRVMPVLVITGGDGTMMSPDDISTTAAGVQMVPVTSSAAAAAFGAGYFGTYGSTAGCN